MSEMKNIPKSIYLNIGEDINEIDNFDTLREVTWSETVIDNNDVEYFRKQSPKAMIAEGLEALKGNGGLIHLADKVNKRLREIESHHTIQPYIFYALLEVCKQDKPKGGSDE